MPKVGGGRGGPGDVVGQRLFRIDRDAGFEQYLARFWIAVALMNGVNGNYVNACEKEERPTLVLHRVIKKLETCFVIPGLRKAIEV